MKPRPMPDSSQGWMLDTMIFNRLVDHIFDFEVLPPGQLWATPIQYAELSRAEGIRKEVLLQKFQDIGPKMGFVPFTFDLDGAGWGQGAWGTPEQIAFADSFLQAMKPHKNNLADSLIATSARFNSLGLITCDTDLCKVARQHGLFVFMPPQLWANNTAPARPNGKPQTISSKSKQFQRMRRHSHFFTN